jgi:hypothetical protein
MPPFNYGILISNTRRLALGVVLVRLCLLCLGGSAIVWGLTVFPILWQQSFLQRIAADIKARTPFADDALRNVTARLDDAEQAVHCRPSALQAGAIIRIRLLEDAISAGSRGQINDGMDKLQRSLEESLSCAPSDPFLWMVLYWLNVTQNGFEPKYIAQLRLSYRSGPYEGWIALKRNQLALSMYQTLPQDVAAAAVDEFVSLINTGGSDDAAATFVRSGPLLKSRMLSRLSEVRIRHREEFSTALSRLEHEPQPLVIEPQEKHP